MPSVFDISTYTWEQDGILYVAHGWAREIVINNAARNLADQTRYLLVAGTPMCLVASQTYWLPVRRDTSASDAYASGAAETTITLTNSAHPFHVGDTIQARTGVDDGTAANLGAITAVNLATPSVVVAGDESGNIADGDYIDVTNSATVDGAGILLNSVEMFDDGAQAAVDKTGIVLVHGVIIAGSIKGPLGSADLQLAADMPQISIIT